MRNTIEYAKRLSRETGQEMNTGHMLLAMTRGRGRSAALLRNFGVSEGKVRAQLREGAAEPERIVRAIPNRARAVTQSFRPGEKSSASDPSDLHLLLTLLKAKETVANNILQGLQVNMETMRMHTLACLTGHASGAQPRGSATDLGDAPTALPLERLLTDRLGCGETNDAPAAETGTRPLRAQPKRRRVDGRLRASQLIHAGKTIEQIQRKNRSGRTPVPAIPRERPLPVSEPPIVPAEATAPAPAFELSPKQFPLLSKIGRNLTEEARLGRIDSLVGREQELERIADVLSKRRANSPCIIGPSGVGKTALVEGLAMSLAAADDSQTAGRAIIELRPADLVAGTSVRGALSERLAQLRQEVVTAAGNVVLFFDEIHALLATNDGQEAIQELKTALGKGELPCIAATTTEEYVKYIETDPALARRFTKIEIEEPSESEAIDILTGIIDAYEHHHNVCFDSEAIAAAVRLSTRFIHDSALPDKAITLVDTAGARARRQGAHQVTADDISVVVAEQIGVPKDRLGTSHHEHLLRLEAVLAERIVGHEHVLGAIGETLRRNAAGFRNRRPIGSFLFLGPTGVGKTETAKALGDFLFPSKGAFLRFDMSEFQEAHAVARLIGAPPGYVGHQEGGQLTEAVRRRPYSLVLLDEIEKAHPEVLQILLQVLDDGRLTDGLGRTVNFENTIIVMTSNLGSNLTEQKRPVGFGATETSPSRDLHAKVIGAVRATLPPELWNRIDELLVFEPLTKDDALRIAALMLNHVGRQLESENGICLDIGDGMLEALAAAGGYDPAFGARPMRRTIQQLVEGPLSKLILEGRVPAGSTVVGVGQDATIDFSVSKTGTARTGS